MLLILWSFEYLFEYLLILFSNLLLFLIFLFLLFLFTLSIIWLFFLILLPVVFLFAFIIILQIIILVKNWKNKVIAIEIDLKFGIDFKLNFGNHRIRLLAGYLAKIVPVQADLLPIKIWNQFLRIVSFFVDKRGLLAIILLFAIAIAIVFLKFHLFQKELAFILILILYLWFLLITINLKQLNPKELIDFSLKFK